jgi:hypothetical protein
MSKSLLHHALGPKGYEYQRTEYLNGKLFFHVKKKVACQYCANVFHLIYDMAVSLFFIAKGRGFP